MKRFLYVLIALLAFLLVAGGTSRAQDSGTFPRTLTDGAGNKITINAKPVRIVSATVSTDEILFSLVEPSRLVAITAFASEPAVSNIVEQAKLVPNKITKVDPEAIIAYKPDLVLVASFTDAGIVKQLRDAKLTVFLIGNFNTIKGIEDNITLLGQVVGEEARAAKIVGDMEAKLKTIADAVKGVKPLTVIYYGPEGYSVSAGSTIDDVIVKAGGVNGVTVGGVKDPFPKLSDEFVVKLDPDAILLSGYNSYSPGFVENFNKNPNFQTLKAIKNKRVVVANDAHVATVSQYIVEGVSDVAAFLYPEAYKPTPVPTASATASATMSATAAATAKP